jgi:Na+-translocating ferredoxin:NAD+ oxidoreductase RnfA subunit
MKKAVTKLGVGVSYLLMLVAFADIAHAITSIEVPEVDTSSMGAAVALLVSGYLITVSKLRRK